MADKKKPGLGLAILLGKGAPSSKGAPDAAPPDTDEDEGAIGTEPEETESEAPADVATALDEAGIDAAKQGALYRAMCLACQHEMSGKD